MKKFLFILLFLFSTQALAEKDDIWVVVSGVSYHFERDKGYNETNWGIGVEYSLTDNLRLIGGGYKNSLHAHSSYFGVAYLPWKVYGLDLGGSVVMIDGYSDPVSKYVPVVVPTAVFEKDGFGVNFAVVPPNSANGGAIGIQLKFQID